MQLIIKSRLGGWPFSTVLFGAFVCILLGDTGLAQNSSKLRSLKGHVPPGLTNLASLGNLPPDQHLNLALTLSVNDTTALDQLLSDIYDPSSPNYHHYITPQEFADRFGAKEESYAAIKAFAQTNNLAITATHPNRLVLDVNGSVSDIERTFHIKLRRYNHPSEPRIFFAPDSEPLVDSASPILNISGLNNYWLPHPHLKSTPLDQKSSITPQSGSGPSGTYAGNDFRKAYVPGTPLNGSGQAVGLLEFDGYYSSDITAYNTQIGLVGTVPQLVNVPVDGGVFTPGGGNGEVSLDIQMVIAMAPGVSKIYVYEAPNPSPWVDLLSRMANDNLAKQLSCSWGNGPPDAASENIFKQMAAQGQSFFNASGDSDAFTGSIPFPSDSPNIIQVGGTTLTTGAGGAWASETVWNWGRGTGSSGGISTFYSIPSWQQGISMTLNLGSTTMRNVPDVALTADNIFTISDNGLRGSVGGTSAAAPLWAAVAAMANQKAAMVGHPPVGFINPALYAIGKGSNFTAAFHDTSAGSNTSSKSRNQFFAVTGYDLCTGWGTPAGTNLINALVPDPVVPVVAAFAGTPTSGSAPLSVNFSDTSSGNINTRTWNFGDGNSTNTTATNFVFTYNVPGTYNVSLTASGFSQTNTSTRLAYIVVTNSAAFIASHAPSITNQPQNQLVAAGSDATFTVQASGVQPLTYQWRFNSNNISGATGNSYTRSNAQAGDAGYYDVVVTNDFGIATSSDAQLTVVGRPSLINPGVSSNGLFGFVLSGDAGFNYAIEGTTNFLDWMTLAVLPNVLGTVPFSETNSPAMPFQAYRARLAP